MYGIGRIERENFLEKYCRGKVLDLGASVHSIESCGGIQVDTQDIVNRQSDRQLTFLCPADEISVAAGTYDAICASHILEHLCNPLKALKEWKRILRNNGFIIAIMPDCRLWIPDRKRFEIAEMREDNFAHLEFLIEDFKNGIRNNPEDWNDYKPFHHAYYYEHKYIWEIKHALDMFRYAGFTVIEELSAPEWFIGKFERELLPEYLGRFFVHEQHAEGFTQRLCTLQKESGCPAVDFSFFIVAQNAGGVCVEGR